MSAKSLNSRLPAYQAAFANGELQQTYQALVGVVQNLRTGFAKKYQGEYSVASVLHGYIDFTYFYLQNESLKQRKLKLAIVFKHKEVKFELWLLGQTKEVQVHYWKTLSREKWLNQETMPEYAIFEVPLSLTPDFDKPAQLSAAIHQRFEALSAEIFTMLATYD